MTYELQPLPLVPKSYMLNKRSSARKGLSLIRSQSREQIFQLWIRKHRAIRIYRCITPRIPSKI